MCICVYTLVHLPLHNILTSKSICTSNSVTLTRIRTNVIVFNITCKMFIVKDNSANASRCLLRFFSRR